MQEVEPKLNVSRGDLRLGHRKGKIAASWTVMMRMQISLNFETFGFEFHANMRQRETWTEAPWLSQ